MDDNYNIAQSTDATCQTSCLLGRALPATGLLYVPGATDDELTLTAENGSIVNTDGVNRGLIAGSKVTLIAKGSNSQLGAEDSHLVIAVEDEECNNPMLPMPDCSMSSTISANLSVVADSEVYLESDTVASLIGVDDTVQLFNVIEFGSSVLGTVGVKSFVFRTENFVYNKDKNCDTRNPGGVPTIHTSDSTFVLSGSGGCYDVSVSACYLTPV